ncbi:MAG: DUF4410 domain-containing protein [Verrucomicrobiia bacterium]
MKHLLPVISFAIPLLLGGCASVSVTRVRHDAPEKAATRPSVIYVQPFAIDQGEFNVDRVADELAQFKKDLATVMQDYLVALAQKHLGVTARAVSAYPKGETGWLITGHFTRVNQGSRALRMVIGFGAGGTKMETAVRVDDLGPNPDRRFLNFETTGGSGAEPGAITGGGLSGVAVSAATGVGKGVSEDCARTAKMIIATLSEYMALQGWILPEDALVPKREN